MLMAYGKQRGMTLVELMVAMTLGLVVVGAVMAVYLMTLKSSGETLKSGRLNQEVAAIMNIMANDIRRAGYANANADAADNDAPTPDWNDPGNTDANDLNNFKEPHTNPFNQLGSTALEVRAVATNNTSQTTGDCIVYAYDAYNDGVVGEMGSSVDPANPEFPGKESFGFKLVKTTVGGVEYGAIMMRKSIGSGEVTNNCAHGSWETLNDERSINIKTLQFDLSSSSCINTREPDGVDNDANGTVDDWAERDCYTNNPAPATTLRGTYSSDPIPVVEVRHVLITLVAELKDDDSVKAKMQQQVTVRNNLARLIP